MNVIYRIYSIEEECALPQLISQDVCNCNNLDEFKLMMQNMYGSNLKFKRSKNSHIGDIVCTIISTDCYNPENYLSLIEYSCDNCNKLFKVTPYDKKLNFFSHFNYNKQLLEKLNPNKYKEDNIDSKVFCCQKCYDRYLESKIIEYKKLNEKIDYVPMDWEFRSDWNKCGGYIYMITKKSTQEFYVGQTNALPIFRWAQHLKTERFPLENICDYQFEVLEIVKNIEELDLKEAYWINQKRNENPIKSLNKVIPKM